MPVQIEPAFKKKWLGNREIDCPMSGIPSQLEFQNRSSSCNKHSFENWWINKSTDQ